MSSSPLIYKHFEEQQIFVEENEFQDIDSNIEIKIAKMKQYLQDLRSTQKALIKENQFQNIDIKIANIEQNLQIFLNQLSIQDREWAKSEILFNDINFINSDESNISSEWLLNQCRSFRNRINHICGTFIEIRNNLLPLITIGDELTALEKEVINKESLKDLHNQLQNIKDQDQKEQNSFVSEINKLRYLVYKKLYVVLEKKAKLCESYHDKAEKLRSNHSQESKRIENETQDPEAKVIYYQKFEDSINQLHALFMEEITDYEQELIGIYNELKVLENDFPTQEKMEKSSLNNYIKTKYELEKKDFLSIISELESLIKTPQQVMDEHEKKTKPKTKRHPIQRRGTGKLEKLEEDRSEFIVSKNNTTEVALEVQKSSASTKPSNTLISTPQSINLSDFQSSEKEVSKVEKNNTANDTGLNKVTSSNKPNNSSLYISSAIGIVILFVTAIVIYKLTDSVGYVLVGIGIILIFFVKLLTNKD